MPLIGVIFLWFATVFLSGVFSSTVLAATNPPTIGCVARLLPAVRSAEASRDLAFITVPTLMLEGVGITIPALQHRVGVSDFFYTPVPLPHSLQLRRAYIKAWLLTREENEKQYPLALVLREAKTSGRAYLQLIPYSNTSHEHLDFAKKLNEKKKDFFQSQIEEDTTPRILRKGFGDAILTFLGETKYPLAKDVSPVLPLFPTIFPFDNPYVRHLLDQALPRIQKGQSALVLGTGSGQDAFLVAKITQSTVHAVDINPLAVANTRAMALYTETENLVQAWRSDLFNVVTLKYDVILFDAPLALTENIYVQIGSSPEEYRDAEPRLSQATNLFDPGAKLLKRFLQELPLHLNPGGKAYLMTHPDISEFLPANVKSTVLHRFTEAGWDLAIQELRLE